MKVLLTKFSHLPHCKQPVMVSQGSTVVFTTNPSWRNKGCLFVLFYACAVMNGRDLPYLWKEKEFCLLPLLFISSFRVL